MSTVFREAAEPTAEPSVEVKPISDAGSPVVTHIDSLLATYQDDQGHPYTANYLDIKGVWDKTEGLTNEINTIEGYLKSEVEKGNLENSTKSAEKYLKELEKKAGTNPYEPTNKRISRILAYIEFQKVVNG